MYEVFEHTADLGLRVRAGSLEQLLAEAARALFSTLVVNLDAVRCVQEKTYQIAGKEADYLLFDWLTELLYTFETEHLLLVHFDVRVNDAGLEATCHGEPLDRQRHELDHEVKAITYHELKVEPAADGWLAEVIVDI
jgi:SHS2 domain-containing protein